MRDITVWVVMLSITVYALECFQSVIEWMDGWMDPSMLLPAASLQLINKIKIIIISLNCKKIKDWQVVFLQNIVTLMLCIIYKCKNRLLFEICRVVYLLLLTALAISGKYVTLVDISGKYVTLVDKW